MQLPEDSAGIKWITVTSTPAIDGTPGIDKWGNRGFIETLIYMGREWNKEYPSSPLLINDISLRDGSTALRGTASHGPAGNEVDILTARTGNRSGRVTWEDPSYNREQTKKIIQLMRKNGFQRIYFNDQIIRDSLPYVKARAGHDDHIHGRRE